MSEWFEPALRPYVHYMPVASTLANLSDAVRWLRAHDAEAQQIASRAAAQMGSLLRVGSLTHYMARLYTRYASLYRDGHRVEALVRRLRRAGGTVRFRCHPHLDGAGGGAVTSYVAPHRDIITLHNIVSS